MNKIKLWVNDIEIEADIGQTVLKAALDADVYIPHICSHPDLEAQGGCKLCVVEIDGGEPVLSCKEQAQQGMRVSTKSALLDKIRSTSMELMLSAHPSDCTGCRSYLNCELQALMQYLGSTGGRMRSINKTTNHINNRNPLIDREMERCINCGRCVRVCNNVRGVNVLDYNKKDDECYVGTSEDKPLEEVDCRFCSACVAVCPTGALQDKSGIFRSDIAKEQALIPCSVECPAHVDIPRYIRLVKEQKYSEAVAAIREKVPFPHTLGHVCTHFCETGCKRTELNEAVSIRSLKRLAVEQDAEFAWKKAIAKKEATGKKIAIVGAGPCGMSAGYYLALAGHSVSIIDRHGKAGGMMEYGIPSYRLPRADLAQEIEYIIESGIKLELEKDIENIDKLSGENDAVLLAMGASAGRLAPMEGACSDGCITALEYLEKSAEGKIESLRGKNIAVLGGGNVAFDCARTAIRQGAESVSLICLEARENMLADDEEIEQGEQEGVSILCSKANLNIEIKDGCVGAVQTIEISDFKFGENGLEIDTVAGTEQLVLADMLIFAMGQKADISSGFGVELSSRGIPVLNKNYITSIEKVFAAGDLVSGTKSVVEAIEAGKNAAVQIDMFLGGNGDILPKESVHSPANPNIGKQEGFAKIAREHGNIASAQSRKESFELVNNSFDCKQGVCEASRCLQCDLRNQISSVKLWNAYTNK